MSVKTNTDSLGKHFVFSSDLSYM